MQVQRRCGADECPAYAATFHAVFHQVAVCSLNDARSDGVDSLQVLVVVHASRMCLQTARDFRNGAGSFSPDFPRGRHMPRFPHHGLGVALQDLEHALAREGLLLLVLVAQQAGRFPELERRRVSRSDPREEDRLLCSQVDGRCRSTRPAADRLAVALRHARRPSHRPRYCARRCHLIFRVAVAFRKVNR
jgi:hypothetical protein